MTGAQEGFLVSFIECLVDRIHDLLTLITSERLVNDPLRLERDHFLDSRLQLSWLRLLQHGSISRTRGSILEKESDVDILVWDLDNPTITIHSPSNNTVYRNGNTTISLTVTKPDSWKRELFPYARVDSVGTYLDGKRILLAYNYTDTDPIKDEWVKDQSYFYVPSITAAGQHMLNVTVVSHSYYRGPAYNGSHIVSGMESSDGPVYQYP